MALGKKATLYQRNLAEKHSIRVLTVSNKAALNLVVRLQVRFSIKNLCIRCSYVHVGRIILKKLCAIRQCS